METFEAPSQQQLSTHHHRTRFVHASASPSTSSWAFTDHGWQPCSTLRVILHLVRWSWSLHVSFRQPIIRLCGSFSLSLSAVSALNSSRSSCSCHSCSYSLLRHFHSAELNQNAAQYKAKWNDHLICQSSVSQTPFDSESSLFSFIPPRFNPFYSIQPSNFQPGNYRFRLRKNIASIQFFFLP